MVAAFMGAGEARESDMRIREILDRESSGAVTINSAATVHDAICRLNKHHVGALVVTEWRSESEPEPEPRGAGPTPSHSHIRLSWGGTTASVMESQEICGLITERDIMMECGERCQRLDATESSTECPALVRDVMTRDEDLVIGLPDDDVDYALRVMSGRRIKHLPILDGGELVGVVSLSDIIKAKVEDAAYEARMLKDYIQGTY